MTKQVRLHKPLVAGVLEALETSFGKGFYADKVIERLFKNNRQWGSRDRGFVAETTYEMVRWWRLLWEIYGKEPTLKRKELYRLLGVYWQFKGNELPDWPQFETVNGLDVKGRLNAITDVAIKESFPEWFHELALKELGNEWPKIAHELNTPAQLILRANTLKTTREEVIRTLAEEEITAEALPINDVGLVLPERANTFRKESFQKGMYEVQDGGSQMIAPFLDVKPGQRVVDACAGAGGKTLHLAALMQNKGSIIAMDVEGWKLNELKKRAARNGAHNIETRTIDSTKVIKRLHKAADRLLMDVPCSGTGVIKRNPDSKWKIKPEYLERVMKIQRDILNDYSKMLKPGGLMVYATCSILKSENEYQVERFIEENENFTLIEQKRVNPSSYSDGFFMALIEKKA